MENKRLRGWRKPVAIAVGSLAVIVGGCNDYQGFKSRHPEITKKDYNTLIMGYNAEKDLIEPYLYDLAKTNNNINPSDGMSDREKAEAVLEIRGKINAAIVGNIIMCTPGN